MVDKPASVHARKKKRRVHTAFTRPSVGFNKGHRFGKLAASPCPFSWWATSEAQTDRALFALLAAERAAQTKGREKVAS